MESFTTYLSILNYFYSSKDSSISFFCPFKDYIIVQCCRSLKCVLNLNYYIHLVTRIRNTVKLKTFNCEILEKDDITSLEISKKLNNNRAIFRLHGNRFLYFDTSTNSFPYNILFRDFIERKFSKQISEKFLRQLYLKFLVERQSYESFRRNLGSLFLR